MNYKNEQIAEIAQKLEGQFAKLTDKRQILKAPEIRQLFSQIKSVPVEKRKAFGEEINLLKNHLRQLVEEANQTSDTREPIDITAPFDINVTVEDRPTTLNSSVGTIHPLMTELNKILDIYYRMGFTAMESRQLDDDYNMFESLNFPAGHPARDDYDTFMTTEGLIAPAHTSTMQNRALKKYKSNLDKGQPIAVVIPGRVFRNEDLDATHEHTFYQIEGVYVDKNVTVGNLIAVLKTFMSEYFGQDLKAKIQPFYFPFTEPSFEFAIERPASLKKGSSEADQWLELLGCGMINPNVLAHAGIDPNEYTGFAWGGGLERLVLMKNSIEDIRHFESGKLEFLRQFA